MSFSSDRCGYRGVMVTIFELWTAKWLAVSCSVGLKKRQKIAVVSRYLKTHQRLYKSVPVDPLNYMSRTKSTGDPFFPQRQQLLLLPPFPDLARRTARSCCCTRRAVKCSAALTDGWRAVTAVWPPSHHMFSWLSAICFFNTCTLFRRNRLQNGIQTTPAEANGARIYSASHFRRPPRFAHNIIYCIVIVEHTEQLLVIIFEMHEITPRVPG